MPRLTGLALALAVATAALACSPLHAQARPEIVEAELVRLAGPAKGLVGVSAWRLDGKGPRISINADQAFPMASTFKVAVAAAIFANVDRGELGLEQMVRIEPDQHIVSEVIADRFIHPGVSLSVHNLIELMLTQSDNTATDVLTDLAGGPGAVTAWVRGQGVDGMRIDRDTAGILRDFFGLPGGPFPTAFEKALQAEPEIEARGSRLNPRFDDDPRDTSTPRAMAGLIERLFRGKALTPASTKRLIATMERNRTGNGRIRARLPKGTVVAEKTGTIGGSLNDVGVITLPGKGGQIVLAVFIKKSEVPFEAREEVIADIARSVYDYYLFGAGP